MRRLHTALVVAVGLALAACGGTAAPRPLGAGAGDRRVMVTFKPAPPALLDHHVQELALNHGVSPVASWEIQSLGRRCVVFAVGSRTVERTLQSLAADPRIEVAQRVQRFEALADADPYRRLQTAADLLRLDGAHRLATGRGVTVAVVDTGVDVAHPELRERIAGARDFTGLRHGFTSDLHGTAVAGVLAAAAGNGVGIVGVAPQASLLALKACWPERANDRRAVCDSYTLALALDFALGAAPKVLNLSLAGPEDEIVGALVKAALERSVTVVAAAADAGAALPFPASVAGVVAVRALGVGPGPGGPAGTLGAPGTEVLAPTPGGAFDFFSGASVAAAEVSGVVALILERRPDLRPAEVATILRETAREVPGGPVVDACGAVARAAGLGTDGCGEVSAPASGT